MGQAFLQTTVMVDYLTIKESAVFVFLLVILLDSGQYYLYHARESEKE